MPDVSGYYERPAPLHGPPLTDGEVYDRLRGVAAECEVLAAAVGDKTAGCLRQAIERVEEARITWMAE